MEEKLRQKLADRYLEASRRMAGLTGVNMAAAARQGCRTLHALSSKLEGPAGEQLAATLASNGMLPDDEPLKLLRPSVTVAEVLLRGIVEARGAGALSTTAADMLAASAADADGTCAGYADTGAIAARASMMAGSPNIEDDTKEAMIFMVGLALAGLEILIEEGIIGDPLV